MCEAAGFDVMIIETVGVGQSETTVASMVDFFLVLMLAGAGDELQGIKKGVLELADAVAINKADGDNVERARKARSEYAGALSLIQPASPNWKPPVLVCSALELTGLEDIWQAILSHRDKKTASGELAGMRRHQALDWMWSLIRDGLTERFHRHPGVRSRLERVSREVEAGTLAPTLAATELLFLLDNPQGADQI
jgi:LAO/AO transport system kinase